MRRVRLVIYKEEEPRQVRLDLRKAQQRGQVVMPLEERPRGSADRGVQENHQDGGIQQGFLRREREASRRLPRQPARL